MSGGGRWSAKDSPPKEPRRWWKDFIFSRTRVPHKSQSSLLLPPALLLPNFSPSPRSYLTFPSWSLCFLLATIVPEYGTARLQDHARLHAPDDQRHGRHGSSGLGRAGGRPHARQRLPIGHGSMELAAATQRPTNQKLDRRLGHREDKDDGVWRGRNFGQAHCCPCTLNLQLECSEEGRWGLGSGEDRGEPILS